ncbi:MAG: hypothetical protein ACE5FP_05175 [Gemmatimonadota bacterium]
MRTRSDRERAYRIAVAGGLVLSIGAHLAVFAFGRLAIEGRSEAKRVVRLVELAVPIERDIPLEVIQFREPDAVSETSAGSTAVPRRVSAPAFASVPATLSAAIPNPLALLNKLEEAEKPENPVASYDNITDFMVDASANPRPLRPMDDRSVAVLAALSAVGGSGSGVYVGGGHCPSPGGFRQSLFARIPNF